MEYFVRFRTTIACTVILVFIINLLQSVTSKDQYVQPLLFGMQVAIPYDIANIWNRPVSFSPYLSTFCGFALMYILFFGVITSPFGYMFGVPSQKYVLGTEGGDSLFSIMLKFTEDMNSPGNSSDASGEARNFVTPLIRKLIHYEWVNPNFRESVFKFISADEVACEQLILCYAHRSLRSLPDAAIPTYRVFRCLETKNAGLHLTAYNKGTEASIRIGTNKSVLPSFRLLFVTNIFRDASIFWNQMLTNVTEFHRTAIIVGLNEESCEDVFQNCPADVYSLVLRNVLRSLPQWMRRALAMPLQFDL